VCCAPSSDTSRIVGLFVTYAWLTNLVNRTTFTVSNGSLSVRHDPLPWPGARDVRAADIEQLHVVERRGSKGSVTYELRLLQRGGRPVRLADAIAERAEAELLERLIEDHLGIEDRPVVDDRVV
jgi:hypothetical protein